MKLSLLKYFTRSTLLLGLLLNLSCNTTDVIETGMGIANAVLQANPEKQRQGIKQTLELSSMRAANLLNREGGYFNHPTYKINLPPEVEDITSTLRSFGLGGQVDKVERLMNKGAEKAAAEAKLAFVNAVRDMTINDAVSIITGNDTAATDYFRQQTYTHLQQRYKPIVDNSLKQIGFYREYQQFLNIYKTLPIANKPSLDLEAHVINKGLEGLFAQVAKEEKLIRKDPLGRGNTLIGEVFGNLSQQNSTL